MAKFMAILITPPGAFQHLSPEQMQQKFKKYQDWVDKLRASGRYVSGEKLAQEGGKQLAAHAGRVSVVDGPYSEAKEVVGGYFLFRAADYAEALELTRDCPFLEDCRMELRQTDPMGCGGD